MAAINSKNGEILWRQIFETTERGDIKLLYVNTNPNNKGVASTTHSAPGMDVITVSGFNPALIRNWNSYSGNLLGEWALTPIVPDKAEDSLWFYSSNSLYHVIPVWGSHLEVTSYHPLSGAAPSGSSRISANWINKNNCILTEPFIVCFVKNQIIAIDLTSEKSELFTKILPESVNGKLTAVKGIEATVTIGNELISLKGEEFQVKLKNEAALYNEKYVADSDILIQAVIDDGSIQLSATFLKNGQDFADIFVVAHYPDSLGKPEIVSVKCRGKIDSQPPVCRVLLSTEDGAIVLMQQGKIKWIREEALATIVAVEIMDLPLSDAEGAIENELNSKEGKLTFFFLILFL